MNACSFLHIDPTLTLGNILGIVQYAQKPWDETAGLADQLRVPYSVQTGIMEKYFRKQKEKLMEYWLNTSPNASWETLAGVLYKLNEKGN